MADPIRAALERLVELETRYAAQGADIDMSDWDAVIAAARAALAAAPEATAEEPSVPAPAVPALPPSYIDPEHQGEDLELLQTFYAACRAEGGTADEIHLRGLRAVLAARRPAPATPTDDRCLTVDIKIDTSSDSIGRLCDALAKAVRPDSGYRALTSDDLKSGEEITGGAGEQIVGVEWWLPQLGCDSLQQTLDSIKGRIIFAVRDWWKTAFVTTTLVDFPAETIKPPAEGEVAELMEWLRRQAAKWQAIDRAAGLTRSLVAENFTRTAELLQQCHPAPPAEGEVGELVTLLAVGGDCGGGAKLSPEQCRLLAHALPLPAAKVKP